MVVHLSHHQLLETSGSINRTNKAFQLMDLCTNYFEFLNSLTCMGPKLSLY